MTDQPPIQHRRAPGTLPLISGAILLLLAAIGLGIVLQRTLLRPSAPTAHSDRARSRQSMDHSIPAHLRAWHELEPVTTGLTAPTAIRCDRAGNLVIGGEFLEIRQPDGKLLAATAPTSPGITSLAVTGHRIIIGSVNQVRVYTWDGQAIVQAHEWSIPGEATRLSSLAASADQVWAADVGNRQVWHFDLEGRLLGQLQSPAPGGFSLPGRNFTVAIAATGQLWASNPGHHRIEIFDPAGKLENTLGRAGMDWGDFSACCNPSDFVLHPDGLFTTAEKGILRIKTHHPDGTLHSVVAGPAAFSAATGALRLALSPDGRMLVLDTGTAQIRRFQRHKPGTGDPTHAR